ncbi:hypothetical protein ACHAW6_005420 [Cyclotella cf. meneghiniana]
MSSSFHLHVAISNSINRILFYCESNNVDVTGLVCSIALGVCTGILIVVFLSVFPGQSLGIYNEVNEKIASTEKKASSVHEIKELQALCSLTTDQIHHMQSLQHQKDRSVKSSKNFETESPISIFPIINAVILAIFLSGLVYVLNRDYGNLVTIWFVRSFPRESATIGLSSKNEL